MGHHLGQAGNTGTLIARGLCLLIAVLLVGYLWSSGLNAKDISSDYPVPKITEGTLDLREHDIAAGGVFRLSGEWGFYWQKIIEPGAVEIADGLVSQSGTT